MNKLIEVLKETEHAHSKIAYVGGLLHMIADTNPSILETTPEDFDANIADLAKNYYELTHVYLNAIMGLNLNQEALFAQNGADDIESLIELEYGVNLSDYKITEAECFVISQNLAKQNVKFETVVDRGYINKFMVDVKTYQENLDFN